MAKSALREMLKDFSKARRQKIETQLETFKLQKKKANIQ